jgi:hypothetical protein
MSLHELRRLGEVRARLTDRHSRLIGWGTGSVYDYFQRRFPIALDYLVDNNVRRWGTCVNGVEVCSPDRLLSEDPRHTVVVVYSSYWPEIQRQLAVMGTVPAAPASMLFVDADTQDRLARFTALAASSPNGRRPSFTNTIVVQGPVVDGVTAPVLRALTALYPDDGVLLSTWDDTALPALAEVSAIADDVVVTPRPALPGIQNRNYQLVSTRAGIVRALELGARRVLKTRSDMALLADSMFERSSWLLDARDSHGVSAAGLRGRLLVPSHYTRKFLLYHPSDMVMLGAAEDMLCYWSARLDPRAGTAVAPELLDQPLMALSLDGHPAESYLGVEFCRTIGRPVGRTLADSWAFYRDLFAVVDDDWFEMLWLKNLTIPDAGMRTGVRQLVSHLFWQRLHAHDPALARDLGEVDLETTTLTAGAAA